MSNAGDLQVRQPARTYRKIQIVSVTEILEGKRFRTPTPMGKTQTAQSDWLRWRVRKDV